MPLANEGRVGGLQGKEENAPFPAVSFTYSPAECSNGNSFAETPMMGEE